MRSAFNIAAAIVTALALTGCGSATLTPNQKAEANKRWNDARASVLASLANDQYKNGNLEKCQDTLDQALRLEPANVGLHVLAARLALEQGQLEVASDQLAQANQLDSSNAEVEYLKGVVLQRWQQPANAYAAYAAAADKNPSELSYLLAEAEMLVALNRAEEAILILQNKSTLFEHSGVLRDEIGQLLLQQKKFTEAIVVLREATILSSDDSTIREHLAFACYLSRQYSEAGGLFGRLIKEPGYEKRADVIAAYADCESQTDALRESKANFELATQMQPACGGYWLGLGRVSIEVNDLPGAEVAARKAISLQPASAEAQCLLGYVRLKEGQLPASLAAFRTAADLDSADSVSRSLQGYVLARMGKMAEARQLYIQALKLNPHDDLAGRLMAVVNLHD